MRKTLITLALAGLMAACLGALPGTDASAGMPGEVGSALQPEPLWTPVLIWKDCQRIALCTGCRAVYKCRSCSYQRTCAGGICGWGDVCVWGPYLRVLPRGARIIRQ
jgi:hypothetical protein